MIDVAVLRTDPGLIEESMRRRGLSVDVAALVELDQQRRRRRVGAEELRAEQKSLGKSIAASEGDARQQALDRAAELATDYQAALAEADALDARFEDEWVRLPNLVDPTAADGVDEDDAVELRVWGEPRAGEGLGDHLALGEALGLIDVERAAKVSGSRFGYLLGPLVMLELALVRFAVDRLQSHGFTPVVPPVLVREHALYGTGFFPGDREQVYGTEDDLYLVGTSEVSLAAMHGDEIFDADALPVRYAGISTCFRRESGTYGKDTRGIFRVHQFDKVEMFSFTPPRALGRGARVPAGPRGGAGAGTGHPPPGGQHPRRRPGWSGGQEVRHRGVVPRAGSVPRDHVDVEHHRLPGAAAQGPVPGRRWQPAGAHPQRDRGDRALAHRHHGELSAGRRLDRGAGGIAAVHRVLRHRRLTVSNGEVFADIAGNYDRINRILSLGRDAAWRRSAITKLPDGIVLDLGAGTGAAAPDLGDRQVVALDPSPAMLELNPTRYRVVAVGERLPFDDASFDSVFSAYVFRNLDSVSDTLGEIARVLRAGGMAAVVDLGRPRGDLAAAIHRTGSKVVLGAVGRVTGRRRRVPVPGGEPGQAAPARGDVRRWPARPGRGLADGPARLRLRSPLGQALNLRS